MFEEYIASWSSVRSFRFFDILIIDLLTKWKVHSVSRKKSLKHLEDIASVVLACINQQQQFFDAYSIRNVHATVLKYLIWIPCEKNS